MDKTIDSFRAKFVEEAVDLIDNLEKAVLDLETQPEDPTLVQQVFRIMHTLKGNSSMFGFEQIDRFTHRMETIYDLVRSGEREVTRLVMDVTLRSVDHLKQLLAEAGNESPELMAQQEELMNLMTDIIEGRTQTAAPQPKGNGTETAAAGRENRSNNQKPAAAPAKGEGEMGGEYETFLIQYIPVSDIFNNGTNPLYQIDELHALGDVLVRRMMPELPKLEEIDPTFCYTGWEVLLATTHGQNAVDDVFIFVESDSDLHVERLCSGNVLTDDAFIQRVTDYWATDPKRTSLQHLVELLPTLAPQEAAQHEEGATSADHASSAMAAVSKKGNVARTSSKQMSISSIRVSSEKLDDLMNLVSELVTTQARLSLYAEEQNAPGLTAISENVQKLSRQLRDIAFSIVLIPIENLNTRFHRLVRDLSNELGKDVRFVTEGSDTELDKTIIEGLADPLMHILRNSLDHGIEDANTRERMGKPRQGTVMMKSFYSGTNVIIQMSDDGAGIDVDVVKAKAVDKGLIPPEKHLNRREVMDLLFLPGFSTSSKVTDVSGRGVGMDVVKRKIMELRGEVELDSERGVGTVITIKLPLTLSIIDGLLVRVDETFYVIPLSSVDKIFAVEHGKVVGQFNDLVVLDGAQVPFFNLREQFSLPESKLDTEQVVVVHYEERKVGFVVDAVVGEYQAVLKPLGKHYKRQDMISGATILGDGTVALVMDTNRIIKFFTQSIANTDAVKGA